MVRNFERIVAAVMALMLGGNGLVMLFASLPWYDAVPGVPSTGPFNPHFVKDIGAAYVTAAGGLAWFAARPREGWAAMAAGAVFLTLHAAIHVYDAACGASPLADFRRDFVGVYLFAAILLALTLLRRPKGA